MPSPTTSWFRIEPSAREPDMGTGLQGRLRDPLWLLARQWQLREFGGEDAGSPVGAHVEVERAPITGYIPGRSNGSAPGEATSFDAGALPLEALVEREGAGDGPRRAVEAGLQFLRQLERAGLGRLRREYVRVYPLPRTGEAQPDDRESRRFLSLVGGRVPDGVRLYGDLRPVGKTGAGVSQLPQEPKLNETDRGSVLGVAKAFVAWYDALLSEPPAGDDAEAWLPERMEYQFAVTATLGGSKVSLAAPEYSEGHLDWHAFVVDAVDKPSGPPPQPDVEREAFIPSKVTYRGMPVSRWWEFEDAQVNFGAVEANPEDIARMLLTEFAISYGDDAFLVPIEVPVGSLAQVRSLVVSDTFGERHVIPSIASVDGPDGRWRMFGLSPARRTGSPGAPLDALFVPPVLAQGIQGPSIEEVLLLRDEMANMAWGVERVVESAAGGSLDRQRAIQENQPPTTEPPPAAEVLAYRLASNVPAHWIPLVPVRAPGEERSVGLGLAAVPRYAVDGTELPPAGPAGQLLAPLNLPNALLLREEEVPRAGARVTRAWQLGRWIDGSTHVWMGRRKSAGRGEGSSGLRFDYLEGRGAE